MGDPQAPFAKVLEVLDRHRALGAGGRRLAPDVVLVSIGDHFDYDQHDPETAGKEGVRLLRWLADHDREQVRILLGNHDASRVMELIDFDDAAFAAARTLARGGDDKAFAAAFPSVPTPGTVARDYASYSTAQRELVIELLLAGRFQLALVAELADGRMALVTHAGVTARELALLEMSDARDPLVIAATLERVLRDAVGRVRASWERGEREPLSLEPLHRAGVPGVEGGGLLYHRPSNPDRPDAAVFSPTRPRRFDPRTLPPGVAQVAGHSGHAKCVHELGDWVRPGAHARAHGGIRTLRVTGAAVSYDLGVAGGAQPGDADLILIDGELRRVPASEFALLEVLRLL